MSFVGRLFPSWGGLRDQGGASRKGGREHEKERTVRDKGSANRTTTGKRRDGKGGEGKKK